MTPPVDEPQLDRPELVRSTNLFLSESRPETAQLDLFNTLSAIPDHYEAAMTAAMPGTAIPLVQQPALSSELPEFVNAIGEDIGGLGDPSVQGPQMLVGPNTRVNSNFTCTNGITQSETAIAFEPNSGAIVVGYNDARGFGCPASGYQVSGWGFSLDGGVTFTDGGRLPGADNQSNRGDPVLATAPDGTIFFVNLWNPLSSLSVHRGRVTATGIDWFQRTIVSTGGGFDKEWMAIDPIDGTIIITYTRFTAPFGIWSVRSTDLGVTFSNPIPIRQGNTPQLQGSYPVFGHGNDVYLVYNIGYPSNTGIGYAVSFDDGLSYFDLGQITTVTNFTIPGFNRGTHPLFPQIAIDLSYGANHYNLYMVYSTQNTGTLGDVMMRRSSDWGLTWSAPVRVNDDNTNALQFYPTISVDIEGNVNVAFYDRRLNPGTTLTNLYFAQSRDGGLTFEPNVRVTDVTSNWNCCNDLSPNFGDYISSFSYGQYVGVTWADNRAGNNIDTYMAWLYPA